MIGRACGLDWDVQVRLYHTYFRKALTGDSNIQTQTGNPRPPQNGDNPFPAAGAGRSCRRRGAEAEGKGLSPFCALRG